jgi:transcriptional regulator with XRE-family HTH domain
VVEPSRSAAALLRRARAKREWTLAELARRAAVPASQLHAYETCARQPSVAMLARILAVAGFELTACDEQAERVRQATELVDVLGLVDAMPPRAPASEMAFGPFNRLVRL